MPSSSAKNAVAAVVKYGSPFAECIRPVLREIEHPMYAVRRRRIILKAAKDSKLLDWLVASHGEGMFRESVELQQRESTSIELFAILEKFWRRVDELWDEFGQAIYGDVPVGSARLRDVEAFFFDLGSPWHNRRLLWHRVIFAFYAGLALEMAASEPSIMSNPEIARNLDKVLGLLREFRSESASNHDSALEVFLCWFRIGRHIQAMPH